MKILVLALMLVLLGIPLHAAGEPYADSEPSVIQPFLETAPLGVTNGGTSIVPIRPDGFFAWLGARFTLESRALITGVGGHVKSYCPGEPGFNGDRSLFVAIVPVVDSDSFPDLNLSQAVFYAVFDAPCNSVGPYPFQVPETIIETHLLLFPGDYVVLFGSGLFGATGTGWMPTPPMDLGTPTYIFANTQGGVAQFHEYRVSPSFQLGDLLPAPARFVVEGFPIVTKKQCKEAGLKNKQCKE
jgi:hypothetical protein